MLQKHGMPVHVRHNALSQANLCEPYITLASARLDRVGVFAVQHINREGQEQEISLISDFVQR